MHVELKILSISAAVSILRELSAYLYRKARCELKLSLKTPTTGAPRELNFDLEQPPENIPKKEVP